MVSLDEAFVTEVGQVFDPYSLRSGTSAMSAFLFALLRMTRPVTVIEDGSGYSTPFILRALMDNHLDFLEERRRLIEKTRAIWPDPSEVGEHGGERFSEWLAAGGIASAVDPAFYVEPRRAQLYSFEALPSDHAYVAKLRAMVQRMGGDEHFTYLPGTRFSVESLPESARPVDFAWNDGVGYAAFFAAIWPILDPAGGILVFHNVSPTPEWWDELEWMKQQRAGDGDLEWILFDEPHKLYQAGCAILRRTTAYSPALERGTRDRVMRDLARLMGSVRSP
jgi:hypothetical protein